MSAGDADPFRSPERAAAELAGALEVRIAAAEAELAALRRRRETIEREMARFGSLPVWLSAALLAAARGVLVGLAVGMFAGLTLVVMILGG